MREAGEYQAIGGIDLVQDQLVGQAAVQDEGIPVQFVDMIARNNRRELLAQDFVVIGIAFLKETLRVSKRLFE